MLLSPIALTMIVEKNCIIALFHASNASDHAYSNVAAGASLLAKPIVLPLVALVA
jgi:hypothetical protein